MPIEKTKSALKITVPILIALFSFYVAFNILSSSAYVSRWTAAIDESRNTVLKLSASSTAASTAITVLPGDVATPLATELAQLSKGFMIVLCALYLEKFIIAISGTVALKCLIPLACGLHITGTLSKRDVFRSFGYKIAALALALLLVVPASLKLSEMVENTYQGSITQVIQSAQNSADQIQESVGPDRDQEDAGNGLGKVIKNLQKSGDMIANGTSQLIDYFEKLISRFVESIAIMLVISCIIPLLVIAFFIWLIKAMFNLDTYANYKHLEKLIQKQRKIS